MHYFAVIATQNSVYTVERLSSDLLEVRSIWGTFDGMREHITQAEWERSHVEVGDQATIGSVVRTSVVTRVEEFVPMVHTKIAHDFVRAVVDHVDGQVNPVAMFVD